MADAQKHGSVKSFRTPMGGKSFRINNIQRPRAGSYVRKVASLLFNFLYRR
jgi:hypothetical protein